MTIARRAEASLNAGIVNRRKVMDGVDIKEIWQLFYTFLAEGRLLPMMSESFPRMCQRVKPCIVEKRCCPLKRGIWTKLVASGRLKYGL